MDLKNILLKYLKVLTTDVKHMLLKNYNIQFINKEQTKLKLYLML